MGKFNTTFTSKTDNIPELIKNTAKRYGIKTSEIDFDILETFSDVKLPGKADYVAIDKNIKFQLNNDVLILNKDVKFDQQFEVNIRPFYENTDIKLDLKISVDKFHTRAVAIISKNSKFKISPNLPQIFFNELNKLKAKYKILVDIRDDNMAKNVLNISNKIAKDKKLLEDCEIVLANWVAPKPTIDDKLVFHYMQNKDFKTDQDGKINYGDRNFIKAVKAKELVIEYVKPKKGFPGRDFYGNYIEAKDPLIRNYDKDFGIDPDTIALSEEKHSIKYYAKVNGYVNLSEKILRISETLEVDSVNFRGTGNIDVGTDSDVVIAIKGKNISDDNIGPNTKLVAAEVHLHGSVGSKAFVKAQKISIDGQTHSTSHLEADEVNVKVHKGTIEGKSVEIELLDGGTIYGDKVKIKKTNGGKVFAKYIEIESLGSHSKITASHGIHIVNIEGGENKIHIEASASKEDKEVIQKLLEDVEKLKSDIEILLKKYNQKVEIITKNKDTAESLKKRIDMELSSNRTPPKMFVDRYNQFLKELKEGQSIGELIQVKNRIKTQKFALINRAQESVLRAKITTETPWRNYNEIVFKTVHPEEEFTYVPSEGLMCKEIRLGVVDELDGQKEYDIEVIE